MEARLFSYCGVQSWRFPAEVLVLHLEEYKLKFTVHFHWEMLHTIFLFSSIIGTFVLVCNFLSRELCQNMGRRRRKDECCFFCKGGMK